MTNHDLQRVANNLEKLGWLETATRFYRVIQDNEMLRTENALLRELPIDSNLRKGWAIALAEAVTRK